MPPHAGIRLKLDRERTLRLTWRALERIEEDGTLDFDALGAELGGKSRLKAIRYIVWLGLLHEDPDLTLDDTAELLDQASFHEVAEAAVRLVQERFEGNGQPAPRKKKKRGAAKRKT